MSISMVRIDDRLIHGQVVMGWTKMLNASVIVVPDDEAAVDPIQKMAMKAGTPIGVRSAIVSIADGAALLNGPKLKNDKVFVVLRSPASAIKLIDAGVEIKKINIGNMRQEGNKIRIAKQTAVDEKDWNDFKELDARGIELEEQWLPGADSKKINEILRKQDFKDL